MNYQLTCAIASVSMSVACMCLLSVCVYAGFINQGRKSANAFLFDVVVMYICLMLFEVCTTYLSKPNNVGWAAFFFLKILIVINLADCVLKPDYFWLAFWSILGLLPQLMDLWYVVWIVTTTALAREYTEITNSDLSINNNPVRIV